MKKRPVLRWIGLAVLLVLGLGVSCFAGVLIGVYGSEQSTAGQDWALFREAWGLVEQNFYGDLPDAQHLEWSAIRGALAGLNDPYTSFLEPWERAEEKNQLAGSFVGIGVTLVPGEDGQMTLEPMPDTPAARAGIEKGDTLLQVDETPIAPGATFEEIVSLIRGEEGSVVRITVRHAGESEPVTFDIVRETISDRQLEWRMLDEPGDVGYMWIYMFSSATHAEVEAALQQMQQQGMKKLVLDLRSNPGGDLDAAVQVASEFLADGVVLYQVRKGGEEEVHTVEPGGHFTAGPLAVLVNAGTSSGAEIVAGALQDRGRAVLVGEKTYGAGSVYYVYDLSDGSALHVPYAHWLTPNRHQITGAGLEPDAQAGLSEEDLAAGRDPQLERALEALAGQ